ncbi:hypothetical protein BH10BAC2_BH10BAC2_40820 [soil metagenome]
MQSRAIETFYLFFQGILIFQVLVFTALYFFTKRKELLYYSLFLFFAAVYFFINAPYTFFGIPEDVVWNSNWYEKVNDAIIIIQNLFYLLFLKAFFTNIANNQKVNRLFHFSLLFILVLIILLSLFAFSKAGDQIIYYTVQLIPVIPSIFVAVSIIKNRFLFSGLVANGLIFNIAGTLLTVLMNVLRNNDIQHLFIEGYPLLFVRIGILADMIFFLAAILKKWNFQEKQLAVEKLQSQLAVEKLRNKISAELHDDFGSTLSGISMYSYLINDLLHAGKYEQITQSVNIIQKSATEMVQNLNDLVWAINPEEDSLQKIIDRLQEYASNMAVLKNMKTKFCIQDKLSKLNIPVEQRRNIYLFGKEAINNAVKYSNASLLELTIKEIDDKLEFAVTDNGKGFNTTTIKRGNGLDNMQKRADEIGALFTIQSKHEEGSSLSLRIKIT